MGIFGAENLWGIDLGGTKIEGVVLKSFEQPDELLRIRVPTEAHLGYEHILNQFQLLFSKLQAKTGRKPDVIGLASPGTYIAKIGEMKNCNATVINGRNLKKDLEDTLEVDIVLANDANCFALAETKLGIVKSHYSEAKVVFGVILGTGVGGGLVVNGHVIQGKHGIGGEWGHNYLYPGEGKLCYCGKQGCNEQIISGPALEEFYKQKSGHYKPLKEIYHLHLQGVDKFAELTIKRLLDGFAKALSVVINIVDPDVIVLGGGVSHIDALYTDTSEVLKDMIFNHEFDTPILKAQLGDSAGVFGAALLIADTSLLPLDK
ncbi:ROK family protein [Litoribacter ruber]|nr:ROK family protein [Litoribacter ruber]